MNTIKIETMMKIKIEKIIISEKLDNYADLMDFLLDTKEIDLWEVASNNAIFFDTYLKSRRRVLQSNQ